MTERFVYYAERDGLVKIGCSNFPRYRARELKAALLGAEPGEWTEERAMHDRFAHLRVSGEWFTPGPDLVDHINRLECPPPYSGQKVVRVPSDAYLEATR